MDRQKMVNVSIAQEAQEPLKPVAPKKALNMALALILGSTGALGLAFTRHYFDHTFTTGEDLERRLGIRHLASIPAVKKKQLERL
jgi:capsular polysaccharide biosynthesis protein